MSPNFELFFLLYLCAFEVKGLTLIKKVWFIDFNQLQGPGRTPMQIEGADYEQL